MKTTPLTVNDAIMIQMDELRAWKKKLTPEIYGDLRFYAEQNNRNEQQKRMEQNSDNIIRGNALSVFVINYKKNFIPIDNDMPMTKMTAEDLRRLRFGDKVYRSEGSNMRGLRYVGRMPSSEEHYLIFSDGEYLTHLYIGHDNTFRSNWYMGKYNSEFVGNIMKSYYQERIQSVDEIYLKKDKK